jgi:hypothetical protein
MYMLCVFYGLQRVTFKYGSFYMCGTTHNVKLIDAEFPFLGVKFAVFITA